MKKNKAIVIISYDNYITTVQHTDCRAENYCNKLENIILLKFFNCASHINLSSRSVANDGADTPRAWAIRARTEVYYILYARDQERYNAIRFGLRARVT